MKITSGKFASPAPGKIRTTVAKVGRKFSVHTPIGVASEKISRSSAAHFRK